MLRNCQKELTEFQNRYELGIRKMKNEHTQQLKELKLKFDSLELALADSKFQLKSSEIKHLDALNGQQTEVKFLQAERSRIQREKEILLEKIRNLEIKNDDLTSKLSKSGKEWMEKLQGYERLSLEQRERLLDFQQALEKSTVKENELINNLSSSNKKNEFYSSQLEAFQQEAHSRYETLGKTYKEKLNKLNESFNKALQKEKKKAEAYKQKALTVHEKNKILLGKGISDTNRRIVGNTLEIY